MKYYLYTLFFCLSSVLVLAQYKPADQGSSVKFRIKNFGFGTGGSFSGLKGTIKFDPAKAAESAFDVTVDAANVNTDNNSRDEHLREESYFDVKNHPVIHLVSTKVTARGSSFQFTGNLTIKGKTKEISFPFTASGEGDGYTFKGDFKINRRDFGIGGSSTLSDNVDVMLIVKAKKD